MSSLASSISKMFSGTLVSRILGQVRLIVIVAALGTTAQADAFMVANTLPNTIYNLIAGGVLNAILVPQIVRAMKRDDGDEYTDRLLTVAGVLLLGATVVLTAGASLLVTLYASQMAPQWYALAVAFAFWCIPQVFFYGLYTLLGNVLNARGSFGPYMWAPVVNNIVAIAGLLGYIWLFGTAASGSGSDPADWTPGASRWSAGSPRSGWSPRPSCSSFPSAAPASGSASAGACAAPASAGRPGWRCGPSGRSPSGSSAT